MQGRAKGEWRDNIGPWPPLLRRLPLPPPHLLRHPLLKHHLHLLQASLPISGLFKHNYFPSETTASSYITRTGGRKLVFALRNKVTLVTAQQETSALTTDSPETNLHRSSLAGNSIRTSLMLEYARGVLGARVCSGGVSTLVKEAWPPGKRVRRRRDLTPSGKTAKLWSEEQIITAFGHVLWLGQLGVAQTKQSQDICSSLWNSDFIQLKTGAQ